jgi:hypothetical protein
MVNARQTPILASPSTNIAGNQTNRFITASYAPLGRLRPKAALREMEHPRRGASISLRSQRRAPLVGKSRRSQRFRPFPLYFDEVS